MASSIPKPSYWLYFTEGIRGTFDLLRGLLFLFFFKPVNKGNLAPVLVIPGFLTNDFSTYLLRRFLKKLGYTVYGWELGQNLGTIEDVNTLEQRVEVLYQKHNQKVILIGWSLGGVYAREIAKIEATYVRQIITLGSPFADPEAPNNAVWVYNLFSDFEKLDAAWRAQLPIPAPVQTTALYSYQDGIVPWQACKEKVEDDLHTNILVRSSHFGFPSNPRVFKIIEEVLQ
jgi:pimeloyl-ACP methyl ester carboxylesterase